MKFLFTLLAFLVPTVSFAQQAAADPGWILSIVAAISSIVSALLPVVLGIAVLVFIWGLVKYITAKDPEKQKEARGVIVWGIVIIFVMVSLWGIIGLMTSIFDVGPGAGFEAPEVPGL